VIDPETILPWGPARRIWTKAGPRSLRTAEATERFWALWRASKEELRVLGISCGRDPEDPRRWLANWWSAVAPKPKRASAPRAARRPPKPKQPELFSNPNRMNVEAHGDELLRLLRELPKEGWHIHELRYVTNAEAMLECHRRP
jgi:hypothetical protein